MGERQEELITDHHTHNETNVQAELSSCLMKIYVCHQPDAIGIIMEGQPVTSIKNLNQTTYQKHAACSLDLPMPWNLSMHRNLCTLLRPIRAFLLEWITCALNHHLNTQMS